MTTAPPRASRLALLLEPSGNRVYTKSAPALVAAEIAHLDRFALSGTVTAVEPTTIAGVPYLLLTTEDLTETDRRILANLSSLYAAYEIEDDLLRPRQLTPLDRYDDDLVSILKYIGKTNEQFTKLLLNITATAASVDRYLDRTLRVLDPMAGRGTTLNQALLYGFDATGVEIDARDCDAYEGFIKRWLRDHRLKHKATKGRVRRDGDHLGQRLTVEFAATKEEYKAGATQTVDLVNADTLEAPRIFKRASFDVIVTDAPYGVQHGAVRGGGELSRDPSALLRRAIPAWAPLLRTGGALGLAWNTQLTSRDELTSVCENAGLDVVTDPALADFAHRVDQAIDRDLLVARRP